MAPSSTMPPLCGNVAGRCPKPGTLICQGCKLLSYCSTACQKAHWVKHKVDCKSPMAKKGWKPDFHQKRDPCADDDEADKADRRTMTVQEYSAKHATQWFWGNTPPQDILMLEKYECVRKGQEINVLFAASGDLRYVMHTIARLPAIFDGTLNICINDLDHLVTVRNIVLVLIAKSLPPMEAADLILHLWYSAFITPEIYATLQKEVLPWIETINEGVTNIPDDDQTIGWSKFRLYITMHTSMWKGQPAYVKGDPTFGTQKAQETGDRVLTLAGADWLEALLYKQQPGWRVSSSKYRKDGLLLPFGANQENFTVPNPLLFLRRKWPIHTRSAPIDGYDIESVLSFAGPASNDLYGALHSRVRSLIVCFCNRLWGHAVNIRFSEKDVFGLPDLFQGRGQEFARTGFDRIDISNLLDEQWLGGPKSFLLFSPLLRARSSNPQAALLGSNMMSTRATLYMGQTPENILKKKIKKMVLKPLISDVDKATALCTAYADHGNEESIRDADVTRYLDVDRGLEDFDGAFDKHMRLAKWKDAAKAAGLQMREPNTISSPWPLRLRLNMTQAAYDAWMAQDDHTYGSVRNCEWVRAPSAKDTSKDWGAAYEEMEKQLRSMSIL